MPRLKQHLSDIVDSAKPAIQYCSTVSEEEFLEDIRLQDSVIRRIEIMGEAVRRIPQEERSAWPGLPWGAIMGMRNMMIHQYDDIDPLIVWETVKEDLPNLILQVENLLQKL